MRERVHHTPVQIRINNNLLAKAKERASEDGMNFSELVRLALRNELRGVN